MKSELGFLMDLFLSEEVPEPIKKVVAKRIREVEASYSTVPAPRQAISRGAPATPVTPIVAAQSPSMQRIMQANPDLVPAPPTPVAAVTPATPAAAAALAQRAAIINAGMKEKPEAGRTSPRKF